MGVSQVMNMLNCRAIAIAALALLTSVPSTRAAAAAGAVIELNGKHVGGYAITWDGESRDELVRQLCKQPIIFERDFKISVDAKDPMSATLMGKIRLLSAIRGDRQLMATTTVLALVKREGKWYVEAKSLHRALKNVESGEH